MTAPIERVKLLIQTQDANPKVRRVPRRRTAVLILLLDLILKKPPSETHADGALVAHPLRCADAVLGIRNPFGYIDQETPHGGCATGCVWPGRLYVSS
eukprot:2763356-Pyramimonas_sp.AAC.1